MSPSRASKFSASVGFEKAVGLGETGKFIWSYWVFHTSERYFGSLFLKYSQVHFAHTLTASDFIMLKRTSTY